MSLDVPLVPAHDRRRPVPGRRRPLGAAGHRRCRSARSARRRSGARRTSTTSRRSPRAAEQLGFAGVLTPTGTWCEDAWLTTAALIRETERLKFLVAFRPGLDLTRRWPRRWPRPTSGISGGRLLLNIVTGGEPTEQRRFGDQLDHDERYARTDEFLAVLRGAWGGRAVRLRRASTTTSRARLVARGCPTRSRRSTSAARRGAAGPGRGQARRRLPDLGRAARGRSRRRSTGCASWPRRQGRELRFGIRLHVITRDTGEDAWAIADRLLAELDPAAGRQRPRRRWRAASRWASSGCARCTAGASHRPARAGDPPRTCGPGVGLVRGGAGTALVGSHEEVADRIEEYAALGIDEFILSGYPHLEEAYWFGEGVKPVLRQQGLIA